MLDDIIKERRKKLNNLVEAGVNPYPARIKRTFSIAEAIKNFDSLSRAKKQIFETGRIIGLRDQGNLLFADISDESGRIQSVLKKDNLTNFKVLKQNVDIVDFIAVNGLLFKTKAGEKSIEAKSVQIIVKSLRPLPSQWHGLKDAEERFRKRYLDIILNPEIKENILKRSEVIQYLREKLAGENFIEVETPMLQPIPGGAKARPFVTH